MNMNRMDWRSIGIGALILIAAFIFLPRLFGGNDDSAGTGSDADEVGGVQQDIVLGDPVASEGVDRNGCATDTTDNFDGSDDIYIVAEDSDVPEGTTVFVRLYREGEPIEDAPEITADQDYDDTCINFVFESIDGNFEEGEYEAQFFINGNPGETVNFEVR